MPIYPIPPERPGGHCRELHSPLGFGPRGNSVFFCNSYTDNGNDTYTAPKSSFVSTRDSGMYDPRTGDLVLFRVEHDDDSSLLIGYIFSINPIGGAITFVKLAEISTSGFSPSIEVSDITGGHRVTVTNSGGSSTFDVMDGEKGDPFEFDDFTEEQLAGLREDVASVYTSKDEAVVTTVGTNTTSITIPFADWSDSRDMLLVYVEGLALTEGVDYAISGSSINLTSPITHESTDVTFKRMTTIALDPGDLGDLVDNVANRIESLITSGDLDATTDTSGTMSAADKTKLDGIATGATKVSVTQTTYGSGASVVDFSVQRANGSYDMTPSAVKAGSNGYIEMSSIANGSIPNSKLATPYSLPIATTSTIGGVKPDGTTVTIDNDGTVHAAGSGTIPDDSITGVKIADDTIPDAKLVQTGGVLEKVDSIFSETPVATSIREIAGATAYMGYNGTINSNPPGINMSPVTPGYDSYLFVAAHDMDIWFGNVSVNYLALTWGSSYTETVNIVGGTGVIAKCSNPVRLRTSDGNLPTEQNKLHVPAGSAVCFTLPQNKDQTVYGFATETTVKESFADAVLVFNEQAKTCMVKYMAGSGSTPETLQVYVPASIGYVRYDFVRSVNAASNCDVWHIANAYAVTDTLVERFALTTSGEWECALHLYGRSDFSGGSAHGDEVTDNITFIIDGALVDVTTFTEPTKCNSIVAVQVSTFYDPSDSTTAIAKHGSAHVFTDAGLDVEQTVTWLVAEQLTQCYMAMLPAAKSVTNRVFTDKDYVVKVADGTPLTVNDAKAATLFSTTSGVMFDFSIDNYPDANGGADSGKKYFLLTDNTVDQSGPYNKCYFVINADASGNVTCSVGEEWKSTTHYSIEVGA